MYLCYSTVYAVASFGGGPLTERLGRRRVLVAAAILHGLGPERDRVGDLTRPDTSATGPATSAHSAKTSYPVKPGDLSPAPHNSPRWAAASGPGTDRRIIVPGQFSEEPGVIPEFSLIERAATSSDT